MTISKALLSGIILLLLQTAFAGERQARLVVRADSCMQLENYIQAMSLLTEAETFLEEEEISNRLLADIYFKLSICYDYFEYPEFSEKNLLKALTIYRQYGLIKEEAYCLTYLGDMYEDAKHNDTAFIIQQQALFLFKKIRHFKGIAVVYDNVSSIFENYRQYDTALSLLTKALSIYTHLNNRVGQCVVLNNMGDIALKKGNKSFAMSLYQRSLALSQTIRNSEEERGNLKDIAKCYALLGQYKEAYQSFDTFFNKHRTLKIEKKIEEITALQIRSLQEKKEFQIRHIKTEKELSTLRFSVIIVSLLLIVILLLYAYQSYRARVKMQQHAQDIQQRQMRTELELRRKTLADYTHQLAERGELIQSLKKQLNETFEKNETSDFIRFKTIEQLTNSVILTDDDWRNFKKQFEGVYEGFFAKLKTIYPELTTGDIRLASLLKLGLSQEEIAGMMGISEDGVKKAKSRLKKKVLIKDGGSLKQWVEEV